MSVPPQEFRPGEVPSFPYAVAAPPRASGLAIAALVCGLLGLLSCVPLGIVGLILGIIATVRASREPQVYGGKGLAIAGICTGGASILFIPIIALLFSILLPSLADANEAAKRAVDSSNLRGLGQALQVYAADNRRAFPPDLQTLITEGTVTPPQLINPSSRNVAPGCDYYYVAGLTTNDPGDWIVAYADPQYHHGQGANILYVDGHVNFVKEPGFTDELDNFIADYQRKRGQPPRILGPSPTAAPGGPVALPNP